MIRSLTLGRVEPFFMANKPAYGETARVKKGSQTNAVSHSSQIKNDVTDTFTSSKSKSDEQNKKSEDCKKTAHKGN